MNKKTVEDKFSIEMDAYFNGIEKKNESESQEYNELLELGKTLTNKDFSKNSNQEAVFQKALKNINEYKGDHPMKKANKMKRPVAIAASLAAVCILGISIMQTSFAQDLMARVINKISLGHITIVELEEPHRPDGFPVPDELKGKIFDKDGNPLEVLLDEHGGEIYTTEGEKIVGVANGELITAAQEEKMRQEQILEVKDPNELNKYTCFKVILPGYLPEGYQFDRAELYKDEKGVVDNSKYIGLIFTNEEIGKYIYMQQRFADEETAYETDGKIEKVKINGVDAIIADGRSIHWEAKGVLYMLSGRGETTKNELIKIAESIK